MDAFACERLLVLVPGEEDDDQELELPTGGGDVQPVALVGRRHASLLAHALRADHDLRQRKADVRERRQQLAVEPRRAGMAVPAPLPGGNLVDAVVGERCDQARQVAVLLRDRVALPELADLLVGLAVEPPSQLVPRAFPRDRRRQISFTPILAIDHFGSFSRVQRPRRHVGAAS